MKNLIFLFVAFPICCQPVEENVMQGTWKGEITFQDESSRVKSLPLYLEIVTDQALISGTASYDKIEYFDLQGYYKSDLIYLKFNDMISFNEMTAVYNVGELSGPFTSNLAGKERKGTIKLLK